VEAVVQGNPEAVERIIAWARHGPPGARVTEIRAQAAPGVLDRPYGGFDLLPTT
jgi:acylphosphatase